MLENILPKDKSFDDFEVAHEFSGVGCEVMLFNARDLEQEPGQSGLILQATEYVTESRARSKVAVNNETP